MSSVEPQTSWAPGRHWRSILDRYAQEALELPGPHATYELHDVVDEVLDYGAFQIFRQMGLIKVSRKQTRDDPQVYHTDGEKYRWIKANLERPTTFPCGHRGVRTLVARKEYTCRDDDCDAVYGPDRAREVLQG